MVLPGGSETFERVTAAFTLEFEIQDKMFPQGTENLFATFCQDRKNRAALLKINRF